MSNYFYPERPCIECGKLYKPRRPEAKYCSTKCMHIHMKKNKIGFWGRRVI